ncbi:DUF3455 domain-containing protein [Paraburkholderia sp. Tr-20389]|nr:DUF3455 domain-containing protein [Paraburkholderia sp. Tr-20389]
MFPFRFCVISAIRSLCAGGPRQPAAQAAVVACVALTSPVAANAADPAPPTLSPSDVQTFAVTTATGVQIYSCEYDSSRHLGWVFQHPKATLYDAAGRVSIQHDAGPSWEAADGSRIVGHVLAQAPSANPNSIPQLLLETHTTAEGSLSAVRFVQRLDTAGGTAPTESCIDEHQTGSSPYFARYIFLR